MRHIQAHLLYAASAAVKRVQTAIAVLLGVSAFVGFQVHAQQPKTPPDVLVYATYFEANGIRFESIDELRKYLLNAPNDFYGFLIRDCAAKGREQELKNVVWGVLAERFARRGEDGPRQV